MNATLAVRNRKIGKATSDVFKMVFQNNADKNLSHYSGGTITLSDGTTLVIPSADQNRGTVALRFESTPPS